MSTLRTDTIQTTDSSVTIQVADLIKLSTKDNVMGYGAIGNGIVDDTAAVNANISAGKPVIFPAGTYLLSSVTFTTPVVVQAGASFVIPTGVTLTFSNTFQAPIGFIFNYSGTGKVVFNPNKLSTGYPEWWGARPNDSSKDCLPSLSACLSACTITQLQAGDYYITDVWPHTLSSKVVQGVGPFYTGAGSGVTRIVSSSPTAHIITLGIPGSVINNFAQGQVIRDINLTRSVAITAPAVGLELLGPTGLHVEGALNYKIDRVTTDENYVGMYFGATCQGHIDNVKNSRSIPASNSSSGNDKFFGLVLDGIKVINAAGGNASVFVNKPLSVCYNVPNSYGFFAQGSFVDTFVMQPESASCAYGMYLLGVGTTSGTQVGGNVDFHVTQPIFDAYTIAGLWVQNLSPYGAFDVIGGYAAPGSSSATGSVVFQSSVGIVKMLGFQHIGFPFPIVPGYVLNASSGVTLDTISQESLQPVILDGSNFNDIRASVKRLGTAAATAAAVTLRNGSIRNSVKPTILGKAGAFTTGIELLNTGNNYNELNCSGIDPAATTSGYKLVINAVAITTAGVTGTNVASGVMN